MTSSFHLISWSFVGELGLARSPVVLGAVGALHMAAADHTPPSDVFPLTLADLWPSHRGLCALASSLFQTEWGPLRLPPTLLGSAWTWQWGASNHGDVEFLRRFPHPKNEQIFMPGGIQPVTQKPVTHTLTDADWPRDSLSSSVSSKLQIGSGRGLYAKLFSSLYGFGSALSYRNIFPIDFGQRPAWVKGRADLRLSTGAEWHIVPSSLSLFM